MWLLLQFLVERTTWQRICSYPRWLWYRSICWRAYVIACRHINGAWLLWMKLTICGAQLKSSSATRYVLLPIPFSMQNWESSKFTANLPDVQRRGHPRLWQCLSWYRMWRGSCYLLVHRHYRGTSDISQFCHNQELLVHSLFGLKINTMIFVWESEPFWLKYASHEWFFYWCRPFDIFNQINCLWWVSYFLIWSRMLCVWFC